jgi:hypothetical protein
MAFGVGRRREEGREEGKEGGREKEGRGYLAAERVINCGGSNLRKISKTESS